MRYNLRKKTMTQAYYIAKAMKDLQKRLEDLTKNLPKDTIEHSVLTRVNNHVQELERLSTTVSVTPSQNTSITDIEQAISAMTDVFYDLLLKDLDDMNVLKIKTFIGKDLIATNISIASDMKNVMEQIDDTIKYHTETYTDETGRVAYPAYLTEKH